MNQVRVRGRLMRDIYIGQAAKAGTYAAGTLEVPDGNYKMRVEFYAPGDAARVFHGATAGDSFEIAGRLTQKKKNDQWLVQILAESASKPGQAAPPVSKNNYTDQGITDADIPF